MTETGTSAQPIGRAPLKLNPLQLFLTFAQVSLSGFGGALPWARRTIVDDRRWMTPEEFNEAFALAKFLPGPNIVNFSVVFGSRIAGPLGAIFAFLGLLGPSVVLVTCLGVLYAHYGEIAVLQRGLAGITCAACGLIAAMVGKMSEPMVRGPIGPAPFVAIAVFVAIGILRWPLPYVLGVLAPVSIGLAYWRVMAGRT